MQKILDEPNRKPNEIWTDKDNKFYKKSMKSLLDKNEIEIYSAHNEGKSVVSKRVIRTIKKKNV